MLNTVYGPLGKQIDMWTVSLLSCPFLSSYPSLVPSSSSLSSFIFCSRLLYCLLTQPPNLLKFFFFLVACYKTPNPTMLVRRSVGWLVGWRSVGPLFGQWPRRGRWPMLSHIWGNFSFSFSFFSVPPPSNPSLEAQIPASRPKSQSRGPNPKLEAQIQASRPKT